MTSYLVLQFEEINSEVSVTRHSVFVFICSSSFMASWASNPLATIFTQRAAKGVNTFKAVVVVTVLFQEGYERECCKDFNSLSSLTDRSSKMISSLCKPNTIYAFLHSLGV
jgi:hypothetical protein